MVRERHVAEMHLGRQTAVVVRSKAEPSKKFVLVLFATTVDGGFYEINRKRELFSRALDGKGVLRHFHRLLQLIGVPVT